MNGEVDFAEALRERVAMLAGLPEAALQATWAGTALTPGARTLVATMRAHGAATALVSGGFTWFTERVAAACGVEAHFANVLELADGALTGAVLEPILDRAAKLATLQRLAEDRHLRPAATLAVGDGANDLAMLAGGRARHRLPRQAHRRRRGRQPGRPRRPARPAVRPGLPRRRADGSLSRSSLDARSRSRDRRRHALDQALPTSDDRTLKRLHRPAPHG